jgi:thiol-disulfide isomerase/thioredoxin
VKLPLLLLAAALPTLAKGPAPGPLPPLDGAGQTDYREYLEAPNHRAFAVAPGGAWGWKSGMPSAAAAESESLAACRAQTQQRCQPYAVDEKVVFDQETWAKAWAPYAAAGEAARASSGHGLGQRMPDIAFRDAAGKRQNVGALRGRVVLLHFWGSWCGPCRKEMPELQLLHAALADRGDVAFILLQTRETFAVARRWAQAQGIRLPFYDSGSAGEDDAFFRLAVGGKVPDREIARSFPTTYVLDKRGVILFAHVGPVAGWPAYEGLLRDAAEQSGR